MLPSRDTSMSAPAPQRPQQGAGHGESCTRSSLPKLRYSLWAQGPLLQTLRLACRDPQAREAGGWKPGHCVQQQSIGQQEGVGPSSWVSPLGGERGDLRDAGTEVWLGCRPPAQPFSCLEDRRRSWKRKGGGEERKRKGRRGKEAEQRKAGGAEPAQVGWHGGCAQQPSPAASLGRSLSFPRAGQWAGPAAGPGPWAPLLARSGPLAAPPASAR